MRRFLLAPSWVARHLLLVACLVAFALLGRWQWDVSRSPTGSLQNTIYAVQWWCFGLTAVYCWTWMLRDELRDELRGGRGRRTAGGEPAERPVRPAFEEADWVTATLRRHRLLPPPDDATEAEVTAFTAYLRDLHAADQLRERRT